MLWLKNEQIYKFPHFRGLDNCADQDQTASEEAVRSGSFQLAIPSIL